MEDVSPKLVAEIRKIFRANIGASPAIRALEEKIGGGKATYADAQQYARLLGETLSQAFESVLTADALPDGKMYWNIANKVIAPMMAEGHGMVVDETAIIQNALNRKAGLGLKAQTVPLNRERLDGILNKAASAENFGEVQQILQEPVPNFMQSTVDDMARANAEFHWECGLSPKIVRKAAFNCCKWCNQLEGSFKYPEDIPDDIFRRHNFCRCSVEYDPSNGSRSVDVHPRKRQGEALKRQRRRKG